MNRSLSPVLFILACVCSMLSSNLYPQASADLPRRAYLGVQVSALTTEQQVDNSFGLNIVNVFPDSTASTYEFQVGQVILQANGKRLESPADLPAALAALRSGDEVEFRVLDGSNERNIVATLQAFPTEEYSAAEVHYDSISTVNGLQRTILTVPQGVADAPVVYILQGFDCSPIDMALNPGTSIGELVASLNEAGFATYRVEKSGRGDSRGSACAEIGFNAETAGFEAGLEQLQDFTQINPERTYLLGISLGGVWAPILAGQSRVAGIISFGSIAKTWQEYMNDNWRRQWRLAGKSAAEVDADLKLANTFWYQLIQEGQPPAEIFADYPQTADLASALGYVSGGELLFGRHYSFVKELAETNIMSHWSAVNSPTLIMWGRGDYIASEADQLLIFDALRGNEVDVQFEYLDVDHYWRESTDFQTSYAGLRSGDRAGLSDTVYATIIDWLTKTG